MVSICDGKLPIWLITSRPYSQILVDKITNSHTRTRDRGSFSVSIKLEAQVFYKKNLYYLCVIDVNRMLNCTTRGEKALAFLYLLKGDIWSQARTFVTTIFERFSLKKVCSWVLISPCLPLFAHFH